MARIPRLRRLFRFSQRPDSQIEHEVDAELRFHLDRRTEDLVEQGMSPAAARREAKRQFGDLAYTRQYCCTLDRRKERAVRRPMLLDEFRQDVRYGVRRLARNPGFTALVVLILALGIGANTAIYSVAYAVIFRPLPYPDSDRIVGMWLKASSSAWEEDKPARASGMRYGDFVDYREGTSTLSDMAFMSIFTADFNVQYPVRLIGFTVSASYFDLLGVRAALGRTLLQEDDDRPWNDRAVVLTHGFWTRYFGADPEVVGRTVPFNTQGRPGVFSIVGVLPEHFEPAPGLNFRGTRPLAAVAADLFTTSPPGPARAGRGGGAMTSVYARIAENRSLEEVRAQIRAISAGLAEAYPDENEGLEAVVTPLHSLRRQVFGQELALLMGAAGLILLIACADVGSLLLISGNQRRREMSVRAALGCGRWRLVRLMLTEAFVLATVGAVAGVLLAYWAQPAVVSLIPPLTPGANRVEIDVGVVVFATALSVCTFLLFAVLPVARATRIDVSRELKMAERGATGQGGLLSRLVVLQVSLATVLLLSGVLFAKSFLTLAGVERGFTDEPVLIARIAQRTESTPFEKLRVLDAVLRETRSLPGVVSVALASHAPIQWSGQSFLLRVPDRPGFEVRTLGWGVSANYFTALRIPIVRGVGIPRWNSDDLAVDRRAGVGESWDESWGAFLPEIHRVAVVSESLARAVFPDGTALGQRIQLGNSPPLSVVGIARDLHPFGPDHQLRQRLDPSFQVYVSRALWAWRVELMIQTTDDPSTYTSAIRKAVQAADPDLAVATFATMEQRRRDEFAQPRLYSAVVGFFAVIALALATVGLYGVMASSVQGRIREIGVRMALGASREHVRRAVLRRGLVLSSLGLALGVAGALALSRVLGTYLYGQPPVDPIAYLLTSAGILLVAALACYLPARRATQVDPCLALRHE